MDSIYTYHKGAKVERCPAVLEAKIQGYGYAFNSLLGRRMIEPNTQLESLPMLYDSINYARNASDPFGSLPNPGRHRGYNAIAYADGHARAIRR